MIHRFATSFIVILALVYATALAAAEWKPLITPAELISLGGKVDQLLFKPPRAYEIGIDFFARGANDTQNTFAVDGCIGVDGDAFDVADAIENPFLFAGHSFKLDTRR